MRNKANEQESNSITSTLEEKVFSIVGLGNQTLGKLSNIFGSKVKSEGKLSNNKKQIFKIKEDDSNQVNKYDLEDEEEEEVDTNQAEDEVEPRENNLQPMLSVYKETSHWLYCHRLLQKDSLIQIEGMPYIHCSKLKKKKSFFSSIGV